LGFLFLLRFRILISRLNYFQDPLESLNTGGCSPFSCVEVLGYFPENFGEYSVRTVLKNLFKEIHKFSFRNRVKNIIELGLFGNLVADDD
jgi:hypothetical protein